VKGLLVSTAIAILIASLVQWSLKDANACTRLFMVGVPGAEFCMLKKTSLVDVPLPRPRPNPGHDLSYDQPDVVLPKLNPGQYRTDLTVGSTQ
jgi:hypothetical protein